MIDRSVERFKSEYGDPPSEAGEAFKSTLQSFVRLYDFLSQIINWQDRNLEKLYAYGRYLLTKLPYRAGEGLLDLDDEVALAYYRNDQTFSGSGSLESGEIDAVYGAGDVGTAQAKDAQTAPLSTIIDVINERFGTDWTEEDKLLFDQISGDMAQNTRLVEQARANSIEQFKQVFDPEVMRAFVQRLGRNEKIVNAFVTNEDLRNTLSDALLKQFYRMARDSEDPS